MKVFANFGAFEGDKRLTYARLVDGLKNKRYKKVVVLSGAGISVSAGIPDFRSPGSGIYSTLQKYGLRRPEELFTLTYFHEHPEVFYEFCQSFGDLERFEPTPTHHFLKLLEEEKILTMYLTQNIDNLEEKVGLDPNKMVQAHGTVKGASCTKCWKAMDIEVVKEHIARGEVYYCPKCGKKGPVKPNIVFFGEALPASFFWKLRHVRSCDLLIVVGTALAVAPFNGLVSLAPSSAH